MFRWLLLGFATILTILSSPSKAIEYNEEVAKERAIFNEALQREKIILKELEEIATKINKKRLQIRLYQEEIEKKEKILEQIKKEQEEKDKDFQKLKQRLKTRLKSLTMTGKIGWLNLFFSPGDIITALRRSMYYQFLLIHDQNVALQLIKEKRELEQKKEALLAEKKKLYSLKTDLEKEIASLEALRKEKLALLEEVRRNINLYQETLKYLEKAYQSIEKLAKELHTVKEALSEKEKLNTKIHKNVSLLELKGFLLPPVEGKLGRLFGLYRDPITGKEIYQPGIFIIAPSGTLVRAPYSGIVKKIVLIKDQGHTIFIDHGQGFLSIIGGLGKVEVKLGQRVNTGEVIGEVGEPPFSEAGIYYELRYNNKPQNPLDWLDIKKLKLSR